MLRKQELAKSVGDLLGVREREEWFSGGSKVTADFQRDIGPKVGVAKYGPTKVQHMRAILESVGVPWRADRHSSEETENPGGNVTREAYEDLLEALKAADSEPAVVAGGMMSSGDGPRDVFVQRAIRLRRGQAQFRAQLMKAYDGACAVTGSTAHAVLEAAHIVPFAEGGPTDPSNGLLLRSDIHTLFDLRLISIDTRDWSLLVHASLTRTEYWAMRGAAVARPRRNQAAPDERLVDAHRKRSGL